jgi:hypothetical protein
MNIKNIVVLMSSIFLIISKDALSFDNKKDKFDLVKDYFLGEDISCYLGNQSRAKNDLGSILVYFKVGEKVHYIDTLNNIRNKRQGQHKEVYNRINCLMRNSNAVVCNIQNRRIIIYDTKDINYCEKVKKLNHNYSDL